MSTNDEMLPSSQHDAKLHVMRGDIIQQLKELGCDKLVLGKYSAIVGQFGFVLEGTADGKTKCQKRYKENEEIHITEIIDDNYFLSGDLTPSFHAHKSFFKGIVRRGA